MKGLKTILAAGLSSAGLVAGMAGFASAAPGSIDTTGPDSSNHVTSSTHVRTTVRNNNRVHAYSSNSQQANSGSATATHNTTAGDASSGDASNHNALDASLSVDNSQSTANATNAAAMPANVDQSGSISDTGPDSHNEVRSTNDVSTSIENNNDVSVSTTNEQTARSGSATVSDNTTGGSATTGDASNTSSTTIRFDVSN